MKKLLSLCVASAVLALSIPAKAAEPVVDDAVVAAVLQKLQSSGALDKAVDDGIRRYTANQASERQRQQDERARALQVMAQKVPGAMTHEYIRGSAKARFTVVEYSDIECPFCKSYHNSVIEAMNTYPDKVNWVWRHFPLNFHNPMAKQEAVAAECAGKLGGPKAFWSSLDYMMANTKSNGQGVPGPSPYNAIATAAKVPVAGFLKCMSDDDSVVKKVEADFESGQQYGVSGTPTTFVIDNKTKKVTAFAQALSPAGLVKKLGDIMKEAGE